MDTSRGLEYFESTDGRKELDDLLTLHRQGDTLRLLHGYQEQASIMEPSTTRFEEEMGCDSQSRPVRLLGLASVGVETMKGGILSIKTGISQRENVVTFARAGGFSQPYCVRVIRPDGRLASSDTFEQAFRLTWTGLCTAEIWAALRFLPGRTLYLDIAQELNTLANASATGIERRAANMRRVATLSEHRMTTT